MSARDAVAGHMTEAQLQAAVIECARRLHYDVYHTYTSRRSEPGFPDLVLIRKDPRIGLPSRFIVAELKAPGGRVSPDQERWLRNFEAMGVPAYVWRPSHWLSGEIERALRGDEP